MKSGLEDRNNTAEGASPEPEAEVSMKSGLEDRNNVRRASLTDTALLVSMKSGLEDRNNLAGVEHLLPTTVLRSQ